MTLIKTPSVLKDDPSHTNISPFDCMNEGLASGCRWISTIDVHPSGDHVIAGSLDRRTVWFDLDLASTPYKTLK